jgi:hypothetical protein
VLDFSGFNLLLNKLGDAEEVVHTFKGKAWAIQEEPGTSRYVSSI